MGCGSSVAQVSDSVKEGLFKPVRLMEMEREGQSTALEGRIFLFGETRTQRKIVEVEVGIGMAKSIFTRVRIPVPRLTYDPLQLMYQESQQIFHLGVYGLTIQPPFNRMLALAIHNNAIFMCGGKDFDGYNTKNDAFYYTIVDEEGRTEQRSKYSPNRFQKVSSMISKRFGHTGLYIPKIKSVLVMGGINERDEMLRSCERYNVMDNSWKQLGGTQVARAYAHCFLFNSKVYLFGGRTTAGKLSKKIQVLDLETHQWQTLPFKIHRGIEDALIATVNPNEIMIIGGKTNAGSTRSVVKVDLLSQTYVWDSSLNYQYQSVKGAKTRQGVFVFGGAKNTMQVYQNSGWTLRNFDHKKHMQLEQIQMFSFSTQSLHVPTAKPEFADQGPRIRKEETVIFGNDQYPCLLVCDWNKGLSRKCSVPLACKMRSGMGVVEYQQGRFFLAGGSDWKQQKSFSSCYFYDANTGQMQETLKMNEKKYNFAITALQGFVYVFGGYDSHDKFSKKSCAKFNLENEGWDLLPTLRRARNKCHCLPIGNDKIAVFGGVNGGEKVSGIEIFHVNERKFDIYEPTLQLPSQILCSYTTLNDQNRIVILNRSQAEEPCYQMTNVSLVNTQPSSRTVISSRQISDAPSLPKPDTLPKEESYTKLKVERVMEMHNTGQTKEIENVVPVKTRLVEIGPKKIESESSQMNATEQREEEDDMASSFHLEKIELRQNQTIKLLTEVSSDREQDQGRAEERPSKSQIQQGQVEVKAPQQQKQEEKIQQVEELFKIEKQVPVRLSNIESNTEDPPIKLMKQQAPSLPKLPEPNIQQEFKLIQTQKIDWLSKECSYLVATRYDHIYFLTDSSCLCLDKQSGKFQPLKFKNQSGVSIDLLK